MRAIVAVSTLVLATTPAFADSDKLALRPLEAGALATQAADDAHCDVPAVVVTQKLEVKGAKFVAARDCGMSEQSGYLAIARGNESFVLRIGTVRHDGANMTAAPQ